MNLHTFDRFHVKKNHLITIKEILDIKSKNSSKYCSNNRSSLWFINFYNIHAYKYGRSCSFQQKNI